MLPHEFICDINCNLFDNLKLADQKATGFIAINSAVIAGLFGSDLLIVNSAKPILSVMAIATFALLGIGVLLAGFVIWPRQTKNGRLIAGGELSVPSKIARLSHTPEQYAAAVIESCNKSEDIQQFAALVLIRARNYQQKYYWLKGAIVVSAIGLVSAAVFVVAHSCVVHT